MQSNKSVDCQIDFEILDNLTNHQTRTLIHPSSAARSSFFGEHTKWRTRKKFQKLKNTWKDFGPGNPEGRLRQKLLSVDGKRQTRNGKRVDDIKNVFGVVASFLTATILKEKSILNTPIYFFKVLFPTFCKLSKSATSLRGAETITCDERKTEEKRFVTGTFSETKQSVT